MTGIRPSARVCLLALVVAASPACERAGIFHPPAESTAALLVGVGGRAAMRAQPDRAHIRVTHSNGSILHQDTVTFAPSGNELRVRVEIDLPEESATVEVLIELLEGSSRVLERGSTIVTLTQGETTTASILADDITDNLAVGENHACYLDSVGMAYCWGTGAGTGLVGSGSSLPVLVQGGQRFVSIAAGALHTCALTEDGRAWCWGSGTRGALGDGSTVDRGVPAPVSGSHVFTRITTGNAHSCGLTDTGEAWCWGANNQGQLGNASAGTEATQPVAVDTQLRFDDLRAGFVATCGVSAGDVFCWGFEFGGGTAQENIPTVVPGGGNTFVAVAPGVTGSCVLTDAGSPWCWGGGQNDAFNYGQLGNGSLTSSTVPVPVSGGLTLRAVATTNANNIFAAHACGIALDDSVWCWGMNRFFELGSANAPDSCQNRSGFVQLGARFSCSLTPVRVPTGERISSIGLGRAATCALSHSGRAYCWGRGISGILGQGDLMPRTAPSAVGPPTDAPTPSSILLTVPSSTIAVGDTAIGIALTLDQNGNAMPAPFPTVAFSDTTVAARGFLPDVPASPPGGFHIVGLARGMLNISASVAGVPTEMVTIIVN